MQMDPVQNRLIKKDNSDMAKKDENIDEVVTSVIPGIIIIRNVSYYSLFIRVSFYSLFIHVSISYFIN